jgi:ubiquinone/menaquinone biosynthesis C-methylase UbiE
MKLNWAERWAVNNPLRPIQVQLELGWLKRNARLKLYAHVLEVGCGRGAGSSLIKTMFEPAVLHAMDLDVEMIRKAFRYLSVEQREGISFFVSDAVLLPYPDEAMDAVFGFGVLHHVPDWQRGLAEIARVLKPGGIYFFEELYPSLYQNFLTRHILLHPTKNRFCSQDLKLALKNAGLEQGNFLEHKKLGILGFASKR